MNNRRVHRVDDTSPDSWFKRLPTITRNWFGASVVLTLSVNFGLIDYYTIMYDTQAIKEGFQLWRLLTPLLYAGSFDIGTLFCWYAMIIYSEGYERGGPFNTGAGGKSSDYAFCLLLGAIMRFLSFSLGPAYFARSRPHCRFMVDYVMYVWTKRFPTARARMFVFDIPAIWLPFATLLLYAFVQADYTSVIYAIFFGHIYYFLADVVPKVYARDVLRTPEFLIDYFDANDANERRREAGARPAHVGHQWGSGGQRLGTN